MSFKFNDYLDGEIFKDIEGFEGIYKISNYGRIINNKKIRKTKPDFFGYEFIILQKNGIRYRKKVHTLVMYTFVGERPDGLHCCHNDGNKMNNKLVNLRYDTPSNNERDKKIHGTGKQGERHHNHKLKSIDVIEIRKLLSENSMTQVEISKIYNITNKMVSRIKLGLNWKEIV